MAIKWLFQGDSITDCGRDRSNPHDLGQGYAVHAAAFLRKAYPQVDFEFIDLGICANKTKDLVERLETDVVDIQPDVISILIGVNDVRRRADGPVDNDTFEAQYRVILDAIKKRTHAKLMMMEPFLIPVEDNNAVFREDLAPKIDIIRKLAREYADVYLPTDGLLQSACIDYAPTTLSEDGIHLVGDGCVLVGRIYAEYAARIIEKMA